MHCSSSFSTLDPPGSAERVTFVAPFRSSATKTSMNTNKFCPVCSKPLAPDAPHGLCPECLLKAALPSAAPSAMTGAAPRPHQRFVAPEPAALSPHFPQLEVLE